MKKRRIYSENQNICIAALPRSVRDEGPRGGSLTCEIQWALQEKSARVGGLVWRTEAKAFCLKLGVRAQNATSATQSPSGRCSVFRELGKSAEPAGPARGQDAEQEGPRAVVRGIAGLSWGHWGSFGSLPSRTQHTLPETWFTCQALVRGETWREQTNISFGMISVPPLHTHTHTHTQSLTLCLNERLEIFQRAFLILSVVV